MKLNTDTKVILAGVLILGVGAWYVKRQVSNAAGAAVDGITRTLGGAWDSLTSGLSSAGSAVYSSAGAVADAMGVRGYTDPRTGVYTPYGAVPDSFRPDPGPSYLGGWGSTAVRAAQQADIRRIDNAIDFATPTPGEPIYDAMGNQTGYTY
jgi:hypothetical protein